MFNIDTDLTIADDTWKYIWYSTGESALGQIAATSGKLIDLAALGIIPNDGYDYLLYCSGYVWTGATSGNIASIWIYGGDNITDTNIVRLSLAYRLTRTASNSVHGCSCWFPLINNNRKLFLYNSGNSTTTGWGFHITGYRRLGTNE